MKKYFVCVGVYNESYDSIVKATVKAYQLAYDYFPCHICDEYGEVLAIFSNDNGNVVVSYE